MRVSIAIGGVRGGGAAVRSILLVSATVEMGSKECEGGGSTHPKWSWSAKGPFKGALCNIGQYRYWGQKFGTDAFICTFRHRCRKHE